MDLWALQLPRNGKAVLCMRVVVFTERSFYTRPFSLRIDASHQFFFRYADSIVHYWFSVVYDTYMLWCGVDASSSNVNEKEAKNGDRCAITMPIVLEEKC